MFIKYRFRSLNLILIIGIIFIFSLCALDKEGKKVSTSGIEYRLLGNENNGPLLIFHSGLATEIDILLPYQKKLAKKYRVLCFNRGGYGKSKISSMPRSPQTINTELKELLKELDLKPPYIMVGTSLGGFYAKSYAAEFPKEVNAVVTVDTPIQNRYEKLLDGFTIEEITKLKEDEQNFFISQDFGKAGNSEIDSIWKFDDNRENFYDFSKLVFSDIKFLIFFNSKTADGEQNRKIKEAELTYLKDYFKDYNDVKFIESIKGHDIIKNDEDLFMNNLTNLVEGMKTKS